MASTEEEKILDILRGVQLDQFHRQIVDRLHVTRVNHFDHVTEEDLDGLGMAKPAQRRLFEAIKKGKRRNLFGSFRRKKSKNKLLPEPSSYPKSPITTPAGPCLTCLITESSLVLYEMIGDGAFGYVRKGQWTTDTGTKVDVAVKCLKFSADAAFIQMQTDFIKEANSMALLDHPHIIRLFGIVLSTPMMLVTELAPLGCLLTALRNNRQRFMVSTLCDFMIQVASGMAYLESKRFIHRDLAARNVLLESNEKVKIGDFGLMRALSVEDDYYTMNPKGKVPFAWCPPEALKYRKFSHASDVWSFGICVIELFSYGEEPWPGLNGAQILAKVDMPRCERPLKPSHCPSLIYSLLVSLCWAHDPSNRAGFSELKKSLEQVRPHDVRAVHGYDSKSPQNLCFEEGDKITLIEASADTSWWRGQNKKTGRVGMFPAELVDGGPKPGTVQQISSTNISPSVLSRLLKPASCGKTSCDCGEKHLYETPVLLPPTSTPTSDPTSPASSLVSRNSTRSLESDISSPSEYESGYCSSMDGRRSNSTFSRKDLSYSYENCNPSYETMEADALASRPITIPKSGGSSEPMPIPRRDMTGARQRVSDLPSLDRLKGRMSDPLCRSPKMERVANRRSDPSGNTTSARCPLDFASSRREVVDEEIPPPLPPRSLKSSPRSRDPSPPIASSSPGSTNIGESFANEMILFIKSCSTECFDSSTVTTTDVNSIRTNSDENASKRHSLDTTAIPRMSDGFDNFEIKPRSASFGSLAGYENHVFRKGHQDQACVKSAISKALDEFERHVYGKDKYATDTEDSTGLEVETSDTSDYKNYRLRSPDVYENMSLEKSFEVNATSRSQSHDKNKRGPAFRSLSLDRSKPALTSRSRSLDRNTTSPRFETKSNKTSSQRATPNDDVYCDMTDSIKTCLPPRETPTTKEASEKEVYCDMTYASKIDPLPRQALREKEASEKDVYCDVTIADKGVSAPLKLPQYENHVIPRKIIPPTIEMLRSSQNRYSGAWDDVLSKSVPSACNLGLIERSIGIDGTFTAVIGELKSENNLRRSSSTGDIYENLQHPLKCVKELCHPVAPPRLKKKLRQARNAVPEKKWSLGITGEVANALRKREAKGNQETKELSDRSVENELVSSHRVNLRVKPVPPRPNSGELCQKVAPLCSGSAERNLEGSPRLQASDSTMKAEETPCLPHSGSILKKEEDAPRLPPRYTPSPGTMVLGTNKLKIDGRSYENIVSSNSRGQPVPPPPRKMTSPSLPSKTRSLGIDDQMGSRFDPELESKLPFTSSKPFGLSLRKANGRPPELPPKAKSGVKTPTSPLHRSSSWSVVRSTGLHGSSEDDTTTGARRYRPCPIESGNTYEAPRQVVMEKEVEELPPPLPRKLSKGMSRQNTCPNMVPETIL
ncbi:uncharacterized protein LOC5520002 isoform X2 [Nematostella vectensis]|uniref:uncharacterized protein LOC5520002 isoform X2 n=1 Tax=Nematostella vectensis TaxID=45351 RepID=UPI0020776A53|nr:uncharacterized protein LOC5520002 isoform X2 [Nematostella vectensis]